jgi:putative transposase
LTRFSGHFIFTKRGVRDGKEAEDDHGVHMGCKRVARLMRAAGLYGVTPQRFIRTTVADPAADRAKDLVDRQFTADGPDQLWVADITYIPTWSGFLYLAVVLDVWSRRIMGWAMETHLRTDLVLSALNMALWQHRPQQVIHHSDRGCQVGFKGSSQHWVISPSILAHRVPRLESASRGFSGVGC